MSYFFFVISKLFGFIENPINWIVLLLIISFFCKTKKIRQILWGSSLGIFLIFSNPFLYLRTHSNWAMREYTPLDTTARYDFCIVAGGSVGYNPLLDQMDLNERGDRFVEALRLYRMGITQKIVLTGEAAINIQADSSSYLPQFKQIMTTWGIDANNILYDQRSENTKQNAAYVRQILGNKAENSRLLLITSGAHAYRTRKCFEREMLHTRVHIVDIPHIPKINWQSWYPSWTTMIDWSHLFHEWIGVGIYKIMGYI